MHCVHCAMHFVIKMHDMQLSEAIACTCWRTIYMRRHISRYPKFQISNFQFFICELNTRGNWVKIPKDQNICDFEFDYTQNIWFKLITFYLTPYTSIWAHTAAKTIKPIQPSSAPIFFLKMKISPPRLFLDEKNKNDKKNSIFLKKNFFIWGQKSQMAPL